MPDEPTIPGMSDSSSGGKKSGDGEFYWLWVLCILGLDYFSTLAYQPSITFHETGRLGPLATTAVVLLTLFGALPIYCYLAGRSTGGQGSLGLINKLIHGWHGKTLVLVLLGFAATDFVMLKTLSLADAAVHVLNQHDAGRQENARLAAGWLHETTRDLAGEYAASFVNDQLVVTIVLGIIGTVFWYVLRNGFNRNVLVLAVPLIGLYLLMTGVLIVGGVWRLVDRPEVFENWLEHMRFGRLELSLHTNDPEGWGLIAFLSFLVLPNLALGLSGFELSMVLMPQVEGEPGEEPPTTRVWNTRKVLITAAVVMSVFLLGSVLVTTLLIPEQQFQAGGLANNRALAYLAHGGEVGHLDEKGRQVLDREPLMPFCGIVFGTAYDVVTVLVLCLAGTSVMTVLAVLLPMFLLRFGMEVPMMQRWGVLLILFAGINMAVTVYFKADVEDQRGAYATGVLVLITGAAVATVVDKRREYQKDTESGWSVLYYADLAIHSIVAIVFAATMLAVIVRSGSGLWISLCFIVTILAMSIASRAWRADELRTTGFEFKDTQAEFLWNALRSADFPILVPLHPGQDHDEKEKQIREEHHLAPDADIVFLEVCVDDPSEFFQKLMIEIVQVGKRYLIKVTNCVSVAHAIAAIALEMSRYSKPPGLHFGWPELDILSASWSYLAFGEGNIPWKVRELIVRAEPDPAKRPRVIVG